MPGLPRQICCCAAALLGGLATPAGAQPTSAPASQPLASQPASRPVKAPALRLLYTGDTGGIGSNRSRAPAFSPLLHALREREGNAHVERTGWAALRRRGRVVVGAQLRSSTVAAALRALLDGKLQRVSGPARVSVLESQSDLFVQQPLDARFDLLRLTLDEAKRRPRTYDPTLHRSTRQLTVYKLKSGELIYDLIEPKRAERDPPRDARRWELWWALRARARIAKRDAHLLAVLKSWGTAPRRIRRVRELSRRPGASLLLSAGGDVSRRALRDRSFRALAQLGYRAMLPSYNEMRRGPKALLARAKQHRLPYVAANLIWRESKKPVFKRYVRMTVGGVDVLVLGLVSQKLHKGVPNPQLLRQIETTDPLRAAARVLDEVFKLPSSAPDIVVALGNLRGEEYRRLRARVYGVDVYIGDWTARGHQRAVQRVAVEQRPRLQSRGLLLAPRSSWVSVGEIGVFLGAASARGRLEALSYRPHQITPALPADTSWRRRLTAHYLQMLRKDKKQLMPSLESVIRGDSKLRERVGRDPTFATTLSREQIAKTELWYTARLWGNIVANLLHRAARADAVLLPAQRALGTNVPGPVRELYVKNWLQRREMLRLVELSGKRLRRVVEVARASPQPLVLTGLVPGRWLVGGRPLRDKERYRLVLTASLLASPAIARALRGNKPLSRLSLRDGRLRADGAGKALSVNDVVFAVLHRLRAEDPGLSGKARARIKRWLFPRGKQVLPRWSLAIKSLAVQFANYGNYPGRAWLRNSGIREQRTVTPNNYTFGVRGALQLEYDSSKLTFTLGTQFKLARTVIDLSDAGCATSPTPTRTPSRTSA